MDAAARLRPHMLRSTLDSDLTFNNAAGAQAPMLSPEAPLIPGYTTQDDAGEDDIDVNRYSSTSRCS